MEEQQSTENYLVYFGYVEKCADIIFAADAGAAETGGVNSTRLIMTVRGLSGSSRKHKRVCRCTLVSTAVT